MNEHTDAAEHARALAALRRKEPRRCAVCGRDFVATPRRLYCSTSCKLKAQYQRRKMRAAAERSTP